MTSIPQPATDYLARLVDPRKKAYAESCVACWQQGQPFASEWPNLKAEYVQDVAAKMKRYLGVVQRAPQSAVAEQTTKADPIAKAGYRQLPGTTIETYGLERGCYKVSKRDESAVIKAGWGIERRGSNYLYVTKPETPTPVRRSAGKGVKAIVPASKPDVEQAAKPHPAITRGSTKTTSWKAPRVRRVASQASIEASLTGETVKVHAGIGSGSYAPLITHSIDGRPFKMVARSMDRRIVHWSTWKYGDPTPDAVRPFSAYTSCLSPEGLPSLAPVEPDRVPDAWSEAAG